MELDARFVLILSVFLAVALLLLAMDYLIRRLRRSRASHAAFSLADWPIPVDSESYGRAAEESAKATARPKRFRWVLLGAMAGIPLQVIFALLLGVASYSYCRPQARAVETTQTPEFPPRPERSPDAPQTERGTYDR